MTRGRLVIVRAISCDFVDRIALEHKKAIHEITRNDTNKTTAEQRTTRQRTDHEQLTTDY
jgi:hypothetical protein